MSRCRRIALFAFACAALVAPVSAQQNASFPAEALALHNAARDAVGVPHLAWSDSLASQAQDWADELARQDRFAHSDRARRGGAGENLWRGTAGRFSTARMIDGFVAEQAHFANGTFPEVSTTGNWYDVGHYSQIVWRDTREVGCAVGRGNGHDVLVCRYYPAGNVIGRPVY